MYIEKIRRIVSKWPQPYVALASPFITCTLSATPILCARRVENVTQSNQAEIKLRKVSSDLVKLAIRQAGKYWGLSRLLLGKSVVLLVILNSTEYIHLIEQPQSANTNITKAMSKHFSSLAFITNTPSLLVMLNPKVSDATSIDAPAATQIQALSNNTSHPDASSSTPLNLPGTPTGFWDMFRASVIDENPNAPP